MDAISIIKNARSKPLQGKRGERVTFNEKPQLSLKAINLLEQRMGVELPIELRNLLSYCSGLTGLLENIDFSGAITNPMHDWFPHGLGIASDGFGNFWVLDILEGKLANETSPILFFCHDPAVILYQSNSLAEFISGIFNMYIPPHKSSVYDCCQKSTYDIWRKNPGTLSHSEASNASDSTIRAFAEELSNDFVVLDLRNAKPGMGFSWGRYGPGTEVRRYRENLLFAYRNPAPIKSVGLFARIFRSKP